MSHKIIITGGSGFIGTSAVDAALRAGYSVMNIDIKPPKKKEHTLFWKQVDIRNHGDFEKAILSFAPTHILHLAAKTGMDLKHISELSANIEGVQSLVDIGRRAPSLKKILFTSSLLVCRNGYIPANDTDYCPPNLYGESKMLGEKIVRKSDRLPFAWSIVRPTSVWGPWVEHSNKVFFKMIDKGLYFHPGHEVIVKPIAYVENAVYMMFKILFDESKKSNGVAFDLADDPARSVRDWASASHRELGKKGNIKTCPLPLLRMVASVGDMLKKLGGIEPPLTSFRLRNMLTGGAYPVDNTEAVAGPLPCSMEEGVRRTVQWIRDQ
jgi:nucleoside-diphosphate-sugar epimerase